MNKNLLKAEMIKRGLKADDVAEMLGIARNTYYKKLSENGSEFTQGEITIFKEEWNLTNKQIIDIFFN